MHQLLHRETKSLSRPELCAEKHFISLRETACLAEAVVAQQRLELNASVTVQIIYRVHHLCTAWCHFVITSSGRLQLQA